MAQGPGYPQLPLSGRRAGKQQTVPARAGMWKQVTRMAFRFTAFLALAQLAATSANAEGFVPHEASYELQMERHSMGGDIVSSGGRMDVRYERGCEFWTTTFMFAFEMSMADGAPIRFGYMSRTEESLGGHTYRFEHVETSMDAVIQTIAGTAHRGTGAPAEVIFTAPESARVRLPDETVFPLAAWQDVLDSAARGKNSEGYTLFDGWDTDGPGLLRARMSDTKLDPASQDGAALGSDLVSGRSWQISSAYFPFGSRDMEPVSSTEERMYDSGVSNPILFDWGEIAIRGEATAIQALPVPDC